jgi:hypothetical protein
MNMAVKSSSSRESLYNIHLSLYDLFTNDDYNEDRLVCPA